MQVLSKVEEGNGEEKEVVDQVYFSLNFDDYERVNQKISKMANAIDEE